jgi:undecaprenyl-diphosphatase
VGDERWERAHAYLERHGGRAIFFGRFVGVLRAMVPTIAGLSRMPYRKFLPWNAAGGIVWAPGFVVLGYVAGGSYERVAKWAGRASTLLLSLVVLVVVVVMVARAVVQRESAVRRWARAQTERPGVARFLARFERQLAYVGRRLQPRAAFGLSLTAGLAVLAVVGFLFGVVVEDVISRNDLSGLDGTVYRFFLEHRDHNITAASRVVSSLGGEITLPALTMLLGVLVWWRSRERRDLVVPALAVVGSTVLVEAVKLAVHRSSPPVAEMLTTTHGFTFPSGHATRSAACLLTVAFVAWRVLPSWRSKVVAFTGAVIATLLIGLTGLTLSVHWVTDVLGGWALGTLWFAIVVVMTEVATSLPHRGAAEPPPPRVAQKTR